MNYIIMELKINQVDFQIAVNSFYDEIVCKLESLNAIEIEFLRRFENQVHLSHTHAELVFYLRKIINSIEETYKDLKSYFDDLKMAFLFDYFRKTQMLMINGFNFLSQALLIQIDSVMHERENKSKTIELATFVFENNKKATKEQGLNRQQVIQLEHYDYAINFYENQEAKISEELHKIQQNIMLSKGLVDKLHPSQAVKELQEIKERAELSLENTTKIFEETYQLKYLQFKHYLSKLQKPQVMAKQFCDNINLSMKNKFQVGMKKTMGLLYAIKKEESLQRLTDAQSQTIETMETEIAQIKVEKKISLTKNGQKLQNLLIKQRKLTQKLLIDNQSVKREVETLSIEKQRLIVINQELQSLHNQLKSNYAILTKIYEQKREQINLMKIQLEDNMITVEKLKLYQMKYLKSYNTSDSWAQVNISNTKDKQTQVSLQDSEIISILKKTNQKMGERIREREFKLRQIEKKKTQRRERMRISNVFSETESAVNLQKDIEIDSSNDVFQNSQRSLASQQDYPQEIQTPEFNYQPKKLEKRKSSLKNAHIPSQFMPMPKKQTNKMKLFPITNLTQTSHNFEIQNQQIKIPQKQRKNNDYQIKKEKILQSDKEIQTDPIQIEISNQNPILKIRRQLQNSPHHHTLDILTQRIKQRSKNGKTPISKDKVRKKYLNNTVNTEPNKNVYHQFEEIILSDEKIVSKKDINNKKGVQGRHMFEKIQLLSQQDKLTEEKRNNSSKRYILPFKKKEQVIELKNQTCIQDNLKRHTFDIDPNRLLNIERVSITRQNKKTKNTLIKLAKRVSVDQTNKENNRETK